MPLTLTGISFSPRYVVLGDVTTVSLTLRNDYAQTAVLSELRLSASAKSLGVSPTTGLDRTELGEIALIDTGARVTLAAGASAVFTAAYRPRQVSLPDAQSAIDLSGRTAVDAPSGSTGVMIAYRTDRAAAGGFISRRWSELAGVFGILAGYYRPRILTANAVRADITTGAAGDEGEGVRLTATLDDGADAPMALKLYYRRLPDGTESCAALTATGRAYGGLVTVDGVPLRLTGGAAWALRLSYGDDCESAILPLTLPRAFANLHLSAYPGGGACFGGFSTSSADGRAKLECHYPAFFYGGIETGLNDYSTAEVRAGTWIDGRPVYRRSLEVKRIAGQASATNSTVASIAAWGIDLLVKYEACMVQDDGTLNAVPAWYAASNFRTLYIDPSGILILRHAEGTAARAGDLYVTLWYVKAEDGEAEG